MSYGIGSKLLKFYDVSALESYKMIKEENGETKELNIKGSFIYGYFRSDGTLYKIYQPKVKDSKFIKIKEYIQGTEQLTYQTEYLVICSSLKDMMSLKALGYNNVECVAPDSENTLIGEQVIEAYKHKYKGICTLFDNDEAGIKAMNKYKEKYNIPFLHLEIEKDLSDAVKQIGIEEVKNIITPMLRETLNIK
jgi:5S rRNA maturation endonuclease (ribonuclease M5)